MAYVIGSKKGQDIAKNMTAGSTYKASDGSVWKKNNDGSVSVTHNGQTTANAYKPTSNSTGGYGSGGGSSSKSTYSPYTIGSDLGKQTAQDLGIGQTYEASDGSVWTKNKDGTITVNHKGQITNNAWTPTDYGILGQQQMDAGLSWQDVQKTLDKRLAKAENDPNLAEYMYDDIYNEMFDYILAKKEEEARAPEANAKEDYEAINDQRPDEYSGTYDPKIQALLKEILNREDFSYDAQKDPLYQQYAAMYQREGDRAMRDTMAEAAAGAGGMNTYAITAAQQAANNYASQLNDKIPELYQMAYQMYLQDKESKVQDLGILQSLDATQYNRYRDTMADWKDDRNFAYDIYRDAVQQGNWQTTFDYNAMVDDRNFGYEDFWNNKQFEYQVGRDEVADKHWQDEFDYNKGRDEVYDNQWQQQFDHNVNQDNIHNQQWQQEFNHNVSQDNIQNSQWQQQFNANQSQLGIENGRYDRADAKDDVWALIDMGVMPSADLIAKSGMSADDVNRAVAESQRKLGIIPSSGGSGSGSGSGKGSGSGSGKGSGSGSGGGGDKPVVNPVSDEKTAMMSNAKGTEEVCKSLLMTDGKKAVLDYLKYQLENGQIDINSYSYLFNKYRA